MNAKIKKVIREIDQAKQKISEWQEKLKSLQNEKMNLENIEIIGIFRSAKVTTHDIADVMEAFKAFHANDEMPILMPKTEMEEPLNEED